MKKRVSFRYFFTEGFKSVIVHGFLSFAAITVIAACLLITCTVMLIAYNVDVLVRDLEGQNEIVVFLDESLSREEAIAFEQSIRAIPNVASVLFVSKEDLFDSYLSSLGEDAYIMESLKADNPLRDGYRITMEDVAQHGETVDALTALPQIANTNSQKEISDTLIQVRGVVNAVSIALIALLGGVSIFIIANTVRLAMFSRREEISIMKVVGATNGFIRGPFIVEGVILGIMASLLAFFAQWGVYNYITRELVQGSGVFSMVPFADVRMGLLVIILTAGMVLGIGGSTLTIRKFLKM